MNTFQMILHLTREEILIGSGNPTSAFNDMY